MLVDGWDEYYKKEQQLEDLDNRVCEVAGCGADDCTICNPSYGKQEADDYNVGFSEKTPWDIATEGIHTL